MLRLRFRLAAVSCVIGALLLAASSALHADELPRYKLKVGQELVYKTVDSKYDFRWTINVLGQNPDKSWRLAFRQTQSYGRGNDYTSEGYFDLAADGRLIESATLGPMANPTGLFPPLPPDEASLNSSWQATLALDDTKRVLNAADQADAGKNQWLFSEKPETVFSAIYLYTVEHDYVFDLERGLVTKITTTSKQGWPEGRSDEPTVQTIELADDRQLPEAETAALADELEQYFAAKESYDKLARQARDDFEHTAELMEKAKAELAKLEGKLKVPAVQAMLDSALAQHGRSLGYMLENAERFGALLDKPSADWKTTDLDGHPKSLEDYRGKVVLMDFWYRGCGWCIRAMPQIKQLASDFDGQDVVVLGMNNDRNLDDARFVIDKLGLDYETLKNGDGDDAINTKYGVRGWPTLVVLDGKGVVRHIHVGYSPTLRQDLSEKIKELLAEK